MYRDSDVVKFNIEQLELYKKKCVEMYYLESLEVASSGEIIEIPTQEGVVVVNASPDQYIMIGPCNDVYPITKELFQLKYNDCGMCTDEKIVESIHSIGWKVNKIKRCNLIKDSYVYAIRVPHPFKVYVKHCDSVITGDEGDYYAVTYEDIENAYIIKSEIMEKTYELVKP